VIGKYPAVASVIARQSPWRGRQEILTLTVHVHKPGGSLSSSDTILLRGSHADAEAVSAKLEKTRLDFKDLVGLKIPDGAASRTVFGDGCGGGEGGGVGGGSKQQ
jgi:hypothetical protein